MREAVARAVPVPRRDVLLRAADDDALLLRETLLRRLHDTLAEPGRDAVDAVRRRALLLRERVLLDAFVLPEARERVVRPAFALREAVPELRRAVRRVPPLDALCRRLELLRRLFVQFAITIVSQCGDVIRPVHVGRTTTDRLEADYRPGAASP